MAPLLHRIRALDPAPTAVARSPAWVRTMQGFSGTHEAGIIGPHGKEQPVSIVGGSGHSLAWSVRSWFRQGYPTVMPSYGYVPLVALLPRRVTDDELQRILALMAVTREPVTQMDIMATVEAVTGSPASLAEIDRVRAALDGLAADR